jgi:hypothetical protein
MESPSATVSASLSGHQLSESLDVLAGARLTNPQPHDGASVNAERSEKKSASRVASFSLYSKV